jgi:ribosome-binding factor A
VYIIPLGGIGTKETVRILTEYSHLVRRALSKRLDIKFLPKLTFVEDNSFEYAEKIEKIIKKNKENDKDKKRNN